MPTPLTLIIFGATGDLTARKLAPSLYRMASKGRLPEEAKIVGCARTPLSDDAFRDRLAKAVREFAKNDWDESKWRAFAHRLFYVPADAAKPGGLDGLKAWLEKNGGADGRRLFYLAVAPTLYADIARGLGAEGLNRAKATAGRASSSRSRSATTWPRPTTSTASCANTSTKTRSTGSTIISARRRCRTSWCSASPTRCSSRSGTTTTSTTCRSPSSETVKMEGRGDYYDKSGVLRDMFQNHLLQLLTMAAMEAPARFAADMLRNEKVKVLDAVPVLTPEEAAKRVVAGQYAGYLAEKGVAPDSRTPTFAVVQLFVENWRWQGVPFYLRSGKALKRRRSEIVIQFRCPPHLMFPLPPGTTLAVQPPDDHDPARRGHRPELREQGPRRRRRDAAAGRPALPLPRRLPRRADPRGLRAADPGRHRRRRPPVHAQRRDRTGVGDHGPVHRGGGGRRREDGGVRRRFGRAVLRRRHAGAGRAGVAADRAGEVRRTIAPGPDLIE